MKNYATKLKSTEHKFAIEHKVYNLLAYGLFKSANISELHKQMVKGTITGLKCEFDEFKKTFKESLSSK